MGWGFLWGWSFLSVIASAQLPDAAELVRSVDEAYGSLWSFHFAGVRRTETKVQNEADKKESPCVFAWEKPNRARVEIELEEKTLVGVADGKTMWGFLPDANVYVAEPIPSEGEERGPSVFNPAEEVLNLVRTFRQFLRGAEGVRVVRKERLRWNRAENEVFVLELEYRPKALPEAFRVSPLTLWVDPKTNMILKESIRVVPPATPEGEEIEIVESLQFETLQVNEKLPEELFVFRPPEDAERVETLFPEVEEEYPDLTGEEAHDFELFDLSGVGVRLSDLRGKVVLLDFWASWCGPCRVELPAILSLQEEFAEKGLVVLGVNNEPAEVARKFLEEGGFALRTVVDPENKVHHAYQVVAIPTMVIVNREGIISAHFVGVQEAETLRAALVEAGIE